MRVAARHIHHIARAHSGRQKRLVRIAHGRIGHQNLALRAQPCHEPLRAISLQKCPATRRRRTHNRRCFGGTRRSWYARAAFDIGMAIDRDIGQIGQQTGRPVTPRLEIQQLRRLVDKLGGIVILFKRWMRDEIF